jgi:SIT4-associating protein SAP185/190
VELYAELLHSSNMGILQRPLGTGPQYSPDGILMGGLAGLELLGEAIDEDRDMPSDNVPEGQVTQARELPVSSNASTSASLSGEDLGSDSEDEKMLEDIEEVGTPSGSPSRSAKKADAEAPEQQPPPPSEADAARLRDVMTKDPISADTSDIGGASHVAVADTTAAPSAKSDEEPNTAVPRPTSAASVSPVISPPGIRLKEVYLERRIIPALIDMFFEHASNDFLHHVVYDMLQQILNGSHAPGTNRDLLEEMMCGARLVERVLEAQRRNTQAV